MNKAAPKNEILHRTARSQSATERRRPSDLKDTSFFARSQLSSVQQAEDETPPAVPPKSPRFINRSLTNLTETLETHNLPPKPSFPELRPGTNSAMEVRPRRHIAEMHRRNESTPLMNNACSLKVQRSEANIKATNLKHEAGESVIQNQDRSKRRRSLLQDRLSKHFEKTQYDQLPVGYNLPDAKSQFSPSDVEKLKNQAKIQAEKFKVLQYHEVKALSKVNHKRSPQITTADPGPSYRAEC